MRGERHHYEDQAHNIRLVGHTDLGGHGDGMHIGLKDGYAFFGHMGAGGTSVVDVRDPSDPRLVGRMPPPPNTHSHKVQIVGDIMLVNRERFPEALGGSRAKPWAAGISVYDVSDPLDPKEVGFWSCGGRGVHRMTYWSEPYAYVSAGSSQFETRTEILVVLDLSDPSNPREVGRWWLEGMRHDELEHRSWPSDRKALLHHAIPRGDRLYAGWWDLGLVILDISDPVNPSLVSRLDVDEADGPSRATHTASPLPGRDILVLTDECTVTDCQQMEFQVRLIDISDEKNPRVTSRLPVPQGNFCERGGRFGPHNVHEPRPGSFQDPDLLHVTWFNAGIRVFDVSDAYEPYEVGHYVPKAPAGQPAIQLNDLTVDKDGLIYVSDRYAGGLYIFEFDPSRGTGM